MKNQIIIHAAGKQTRIALLENGELTQLFIESPENQRTVGDIYVAEVRKVMSGIRAAFIDMNSPKDAFLHFSDLGEHLDDYLIMLNGEKSVNKDALAKLQEYRSRKDISGNSKNSTNAEEQNLLGNLLKPGHKVLVQIVKEPMGSKGPRVSTNISIAGRFLVLIPMGDYVAVSKRIKSYKERRVLRQTVADILPEGFGVIVRTVAEGQDPKMIHDDLMEVLEKWSNIAKDMNSAKPPTLLHRDLEMTESLVRDLFAKDFERILVDDAKMHKTLKQYISKIAPSLLPNIELYKGSEHIFDHMRVMQDVESVFSPRVKMPSGGYLIFEQTEAMYVVDVNSGRYAAKKAQEDNSLKTNLEAAREIAKQLRLRDIGGIIVVDFIDLRDDVNRKKVYDELKKEFRKDRAKTNVLPMSDFGLIQITRQRIRPSVVNSVSRVCPMCGGSGSIVSQNTLLSDIESWLQKFKLTTKYRSVDLHINPYMKGMISKGWVSQYFKWMMKYRIKIGLVEDITLSMNDYKFTLAGSDVDITETIVMDQSIDAAIKEAEKRIAEMESEHKRDSTTLDIYKKEKSQNRGSGSDGRNQQNDRTSDDQRQSRDNQTRKSDYADSRNNSRDQSQSGTRNAAESASDFKNQKGAKSQDSDSSRNDGSKRNQKISKYYKSQDEADDSTSDKNEANAPKRADSDVSKQNDAAADQKPVERPTSETDTVIPEELSHLRSAWDVAREYKLKRDNKSRNGDKSGVSAKKIEEKSDVDAKTSVAEIRSESIPNPDEIEDSVGKSTPQVNQATSSDDTAETLKKGKKTADKTTAKKTTKKAPAKTTAKKSAKSKESVEAASKIVQALVSSEKLKDDSEKSEKAKTEKSTTKSKTTAIKPTPKKETSKKPAASKKTGTSGKATSGKNAGGSKKVVENKSDENSSENE